MTKPTDQAEDRRQQTMTAYLSMVAPTLGGVLFLALAERYL